jgi:hypothetical protein
MGHLRQIVEKHRNIAGGVQHAEYLDPAIHRPVEDTAMA